MRILVHASGANNQKLLDTLIPDLSQKDVTSLSDSNHGHWPHPGRKVSVPVQAGSNRQLCLPASADWQCSTKL